MHISFYPLTERRSYPPAFKQGGGFTLSPAGERGHYSSDTRKPTPLPPFGGEGGPLVLLLTPKEGEGMSPCLPPLRGGRGDGTSSHLWRGGGSSSVLTSTLLGGGRILPLTFSPDEGGGASTLSPNTFKGGGEGRGAFSHLSKGGRRD